MNTTTSLVSRSSRAVPRATSALPTPEAANDPTHLQTHLVHCAAMCHRLHRLRGTFELMNAFVLPRFVSTLVVLLAAAALIAWLYR